MLGIVGLARTPNGCTLVIWSPDAGARRFLPLDMTDDAELVERCRQGEQAAWAELVERYSRYVYAICLRGFRLPEHDMEDVFQEVFARTFEHLDSLRDAAALKPWLAQLTRRVCLDRARRADTREEPWDQLPEQADDRWIAELDEALAVHQAMDELPENCREVLDRFFCRDDSYRTIAEALDIPAGTVASRISRCLVRLRDVFEGRDRAPTTSGSN